MLILTSLNSDDDPLELVPIFDIRRSGSPLSATQGGSISDEDYDEQEDNREIPSDEDTQLA
jgi:hypothetical protein